MPACVTSQPGDCVSEGDQLASVSSCKYPGHSTLCPVTTGSAHLPALSAPTMGTLESANSTQARRGLPEPGAQAPDCSHFPCQGCRGLQAVLEVFVPPCLGAHLGISTTMSSSKREGECPPSLSDLSCMCLPFPFPNNLPGSRRGVLSAPSSCLTRPLPTSETPPAPCHPWSYGMGNGVSWRIKNISIYYFQNILPITNTRM